MPEPLLLLPPLDAQHERYVVDMALFFPVPSWLERLRDQRNIEFLFCELFFYEVLPMFLENSNDFFLSSFGRRKST